MAQNIVPADTGPVLGSAPGTSDPYLKITFPAVKWGLDDETVKTKTIDKTLNPVWNKKFI